MQIRNNSSPLKTSSKAIKTMKNASPSLFLSLNSKFLEVANYDKEVYNGDIGIISNIDFEDKSITVTIDERKVEYDITETDELVHAFATTIHKAQGSEFPIVVMPISMSHYIMLQRNLLYTGITRAKRVLVLVGSKKAVYIAVSNDKVTERNTGLKERLEASGYEDIF